MDALKYWFFPFSNQTRHPDVVHLPLLKQIQYTNCIQSVREFWAIRLGAKWRQLKAEWPKQTQAFTAHKNKAFKTEKSNSNKKTQNKHEETRKIAQTRESKTKERGKKEVYIHRESWLVKRRNGEEAQLNILKTVRMRMTITKEGKQKVKAEQDTTEIQPSKWGGK